MYAALSLMRSLIFLRACSFIILVASAWSHPLVEKRAPFDVVAIAIAGPWPCTPDQQAQLEISIAEAHSLAIAAISALEVAGSEYSIAYVTWFGASEYNPV